MYLLYMIYVHVHVHVLGPGLKEGEERTLEYLEDVAVNVARYEGQLKLGES